MPGILLPALLLPFAAAFLAEEAGAQEFHVDREEARRVVFVSSTQVDEFQGVTDRIDGFVLLDGGGVRITDALGPTEIYFEVDLASLDTGIGLRDRHMRDNYLEVREYPYATFTGALDRIDQEAGAFRIEARGEFSVHGVSRPRSLTCTAVPAGEGFAVDCAFPVPLAEHDIRIPRVMFLKLAPVVEMELSFHLRPVPSAPGVQP